LKPGERELKSWQPENRVTEQIYTLLEVKIPVNAEIYMVQRIAIGKYFEGKPLLPLVDVRTPAEYESGHIPGAVNIPLFSNEERARVGTLYKQVSVDRAYEEGYRFVTPKLDWYVSEARKIAIDGRLVVYCWRGGMRSRSFADHLSSRGIGQVFVIEGGYKAFRQHALDSFEKPEVIRVLGGYTGSGKTRILKELEAMGEQVIDLEGIAHHKGSAFGSIGETEQPKNEHFTNLLFWEWRKLDLTRSVWLEDESIHIGRVFIPENLFERMRRATLFFLKIPKELRGKLLVEIYACTDPVRLSESVQKISKRLGGVRTAEALSAIDRGDYYEAAIITLDYYDKFYLKGLNRRDQEKVVVIGSDTTDALKNARKLYTMIQQL
jgi:tRNA 2-selenouridine synthase